MPLSAHLKDTFIAPQMSTFTTASIRDMSGVAREGRVARFILNSLEGGIQPGFRPYMFNVLRCTEAAFSQYTSARARTLSFLTTDSISDYLSAITHWEMFLSHSWHAYCLIGRPIGVHKDWFKTGDGSIHERLHALYTRAKHADSAIEEGKLLNDATLCLWLKNDGLHITDNYLTFDEMAEVLDDLAWWSDVLEHPPTMKDKIAAKNAEIGALETGG